jgi:hypothetical protein
VHSEILMVGASLPSAASLGACLSRFAIYRHTLFDKVAITRKRLYSYLRRQQHSTVTPRLPDRRSHDAQADFGVQLLNDQ